MRICRLTCSMCDFVFLAKSDEFICDSCYARQQGFTPVGKCTCAGQDSLCECCIANRDAYEEIIKERHIK